MLVLSRRRDERILIGDDIEIVIVDIRGEKVRVGIKAPAEVSVHRGELRDRAAAELEPKPEAPTRASTSPRRARAG